ncbi:hypothetical protein GTA28_27255 [Rhodococcus hoagii]|nr:hypothetical protein [Prescottella equi]
MIQNMRTTAPASVAATRNSSGVQFADHGAAVNAVGWFEALTVPPGRRTTSESRRRPEGGTVQRLDQPTSFTAAPWSANWTPRRIPGGRD